MRAWVGLLAIGCVGQDLPAPDDAVDCRSLAVAGSTMEEADTNGDGALTDEDVAPGGAVAILRFEEGGDTYDVVTRSTDVRLVANPRFEGVLTWSVWQIEACDPEMSVFLGFPTLDRYRGTALEVGVVAPSGFAIDVPNYEQGIREASIAGEVHLTEAQASSASGYFVGTGEGPLFSYLYAEPVGTSVSLLGMAFREVRGPTGAAR